MMIDFDALASWCGLTRPAAVRRWLSESGIPYVTRRDGKPVTTTTALDTALVRGPSLTNTPDWRALESSTERKN